MKLLNLKTFFAAMLVTAVSGVVLTATNTVFGQTTYETPVFNVFDNVEGQGDESDFVRVRNPGTNQAFANSVDNACEDGQEVSIQIYVHNGATQGLNGENYNGPAVARDTKLSLTKSGDRRVNGVLSASNATAIGDTATITCNGQPVNFTFIPGSALQTNNKGNTTLNDSVFTSGGTQIGYESPNGVMPACWEFVTIVYAKVKIEVPEEPVLTPAICEQLLYTLLGDRMVRVDNVEYTLNDATLNSLSVNYGDGNAETVQPGELPKEHTYAEAGSYTITATVNTTFEGKEDNRTSEKCKAVIKVEDQFAYECKRLIVSPVEGNKFDVAFRTEVTTSDNVSVKELRYKFGDDQEAMTDKLDEAVTHTYATGDYTASVDVVFALEGQDDTVVPASGECVRMISIEKEVEKCPYNEELLKTDENCKERTEVLGIRKTTTTPRVLPNTGAGSVAGLLAAVTAAGTIGHSYVARKRQ